MKVISGKRMCQILEKRGWTLARTSGAHHIYRHTAKGRRTVVPVHGNQDLKPGTQRGNMRDAGLTDADLQPLLSLVFRKSDRQLDERQGACKWTLQRGGWPRKERNNEPNKELRPLNPSGAIESRRTS